MRLDHFVFGVANLAESVALFHKQSGIKPELGGGHPSFGTHNALVSLGTSYFELVADDPASPTPPGNRISFLRNLKHPRMVAWMLGCQDFEAVKKSLSPHGLSLATIGSGARKTLAGIYLRYEFAEIKGLEDLGEAVPHFIRWLPGTIHPSASSPKGCSFQKLKIVHKPSAKFSSWVKSLNLEVELQEGHEAAIHVSISSPNGELRFK